MASDSKQNKKAKPVKKTREEYAEDALYREVWEEVNNDKTTAFIKKYSRHMLAGAIGIMIAVVGIQIGVRSYNAHRVAVATSYETAVESADANALAALADNASGATADLALFQAYLLDKDMAKLERLANDGNTRDFRDLARLHVVNARGDEMDAVAVEKYLDSMNTKKSPFYYTSRLTVAQKYLATGDRANANKWLDLIIADKDAPATISATAQSLR